MQENFALKAKTAIKKIAALSAGAVMLGATITGALAAQDLTNYPNQFASGATLVLGDNAAVDDVLGAIDIASSLSAGAAAGATTVTVSGGVTEDIPLGMGLAEDATVGLDGALEDDDIQSLLDTQINFKSSNYDIREVILLGNESPSIETSLTSGDDDYKSEIVMEVGKRDSIKYIYAFDDEININNATSTDALNIKFLGNTLKITGTDSATKFTANVGTEYFLNVGDSVSVEGKTVTLNNVGSGGAINVDVDGVVETISAGSTETVNGIEVKNDETFYDSNDVSQRSATLVIGVDAVETYSDGDTFIGGDETCLNNNPEDPDCWVWDVGGLRTTTSTTLPSSSNSTTASGVWIGIENDFVINDDTDNPPKAGQCINLPNNYISICYDSDTVTTTNYATYTFEYEQSGDFSQVQGAFTGQTAEPSIYIHTSVDDGLEIVDGTSGDAGADNISANVKTKEIWLSYNDSNGNFTDMFYKEKTDNKVKYAGTINTSNANTGLPATLNKYQAFAIRYGDTKDTNIVVRLGGNASVSMNMSIDVIGDSTTELNNDSDEIQILWGIASGDVNRLGLTGSTEEGTELIFNGTQRASSGAAINIGSKDEDHRTPYGIIIKNPKSNSASDTVVLEIPSDQVQSNVVIKGTSTVVSGGSSGGGLGITPDRMKSSEISGQESTRNLIIVGGPCINPTIAAVPGLADVTCDGFRQDYSAGEALIKIVDNDGKVALLVAGYNAIDTQGAAKVVANYGDYALSSSEAVVTVASLTDISIK